MTKLHNIMKVDTHSFCLSTALFTRTARCLLYKPQTTTNDIRNNQSFYFPQITTLPREEKLGLTLFVLPLRYSSTIEKTSDLCSFNCSGKFLCSAVKYNNSVRCNGQNTPDFKNFIFNIYMLYQQCRFAKRRN